MNIRPPRTLFALLASIACIPLALAQSLAPNAAAGTGTVAGRVSNAATTTYLEGAVVTLEPGNRSTLTSVTGEFEFQNVPAGMYTVVAAYTGLDTKSAPVSV